MTLWSILRSRFIADERGAALVIVVIFVPVLILVAALAIDSANWFTHHSHLQTQADAAALAAAQDFQFPCTPTVEEQITTDVHHYDGTQTGPGNYNQQVATPSPHGNVEHKVVSLINAANFFGQSTPGDVLPSSPCAARAIDVKVTETNVPWYLQLLNVSHINAQARVSIEALASSGGQLPLGVPNPAPNAVHATFFDETTNSELGGVDLTHSSDHLTWTSSGATPVTFSSASSGDVGVRFALSGTSSTTCGSKYVECYDSGSLNKEGIPTTGVLFIRSWSGDGTPGVPLPPATAPAGPQAQDVTLSPVTCPDGYFASEPSACEVQLSATMAFASGITCTGSSPQASLTLTAVDGSGNSSTPAINCPTSGSATGVWTSTVRLPPNSGPMTFSLSWIQATGTKPAGATGGTNATPSLCTTHKPCEGSFGLVQRTFAGAPDAGSAASSRSGPISSATVIDQSTGGEGNSFRRCSATTGFVFTKCTPSLLITLTVRGFQNEETINPSAAPVALRLTGNQGNQALDCSGNNGASAFTTMLATGCPNPPGPFGTTTGDESICPGSNPVVCVKSNPGEGKKLEPGINARVNCNGITAGCSESICVNPNHWTSPNTVSQILSASPRDPRLVHVFIVDSGSFANRTGTFYVPIRIFATFYITGWKGSPCTTTNTSPPSGLPYRTDDSAATGELLGHFVKYVEPPGEGSGSGEGSCTASETLGDCVAVLTK